LKIRKVKKKLYFQSIAYNKLLKNLTEHFNNKFPNKLNKLNIYIKIYKIKKYHTLLNFRRY